MDDKGPTAKPDEVERYLRNLGAQDWGASLDVAVLPRKRKAARIAASRPRRREPGLQRNQPRAKPKPEPKPKPRQIREPPSRPMPGCWSN